MRPGICGCCSVTSRCSALPGVSCSCPWRSRTIWSSAVCGSRPAPGGRGAGAATGNGYARRQTQPGSPGSGQRPAERQSVASFRAALAGVAGVPRLAPRCGPSAAGRGTPARRRRPARPAHRRDDAAVAAAARRVPGGTAAAAEQTYRSQADPGSCPYYGRVTRDRGFVALQYWFLYAMNDWRSTFGGVNDHEADWEQVTVFLPDPPDPSARPAWVAFSYDDEAGDDLRRRPDDPDLQWRDTHPIVFAAPDRTPAPTCRAITWSPWSRPRSGACSPHCASWAGCCSHGHARTPAPRSASRSLTIAAATVPAWGPARQGNGARSSWTTRPPGCMTTGGCGGWTRRPVRRGARPRGSAL